MKFSNIMIINKIKSSRFGLVALLGIILGILFIILFPKIVNQFRIPGELTWSLIGGGLVTIFVTVLRGLNRLEKYHATFRKAVNNNTFLIYRKGKQGNAIIKVKLSVEENNIYFTGNKLSDNSKFYGSITMDENLLVYGKGFYNHEHLEGYGFLEVQYDKKENKFYSHAPYIDPSQGNKRVNQAWIWEMD